MLLKKRIWNFNELETYYELAGLDLTKSEIRKLIQHEEFFKASSIDYVATQVQSEYIDQILGFAIHDIELELLNQAKNLTLGTGHKSWSSALHEGQQTWVGLRPKELQTPYSEFYDLLQSLEIPKGKHILDLGSAYGRMGIVANHLDSSLSFTGIEYVKERVDEGNRIYEEAEIKNSSLIEADIADDNFSLPDADIYFLYDFGKVEHIKKTLNILADKVEASGFILVARGRGVKSLIQYEAPWLIELEDIPTKDSYQVFSTNGTLDIY